MHDSESEDSGLDAETTAQSSLIVKQDDQVPPVRGSRQSGM